jgi:hypothetical protein
MDLLMALFSSDDEDDLKGMSRGAKIALAALIVLLSLGGAALWWQVAVDGR